MAPRNFRVRGIQTSRERRSKRRRCSTGKVHLLLLSSSQLVTRIRHHSITLVSVNQSLILVHVCLFYFLCFEYDPLRHDSMCAVIWFQHAPDLGLAGNLCLAECIWTRFDKLDVLDVILVQAPQIPRALEGQSVKYIIDPKSSDRCETAVVCQFSA